MPGYKTSLPSQLCTFDFESKSYADLTKVGQLVYSQDPTTDVICACWGIGDGEIQEWWPDKNETTDMPEDLADHLYTGGHIEAHNVAFERSMWISVMHKRYGWVIPHDSAWRCSMAVAAYYSLPAALDRLAQVLGFGRKNPEGGRLITKYSKLYLKTAKTEIPDEDFFKFVDYCVWDVHLERLVSRFLGDLPDNELGIWQQDQRINARGLYLDEEGILAASRVVDEISERLSGEFRDIVGLNHTQREKVLLWCEANGVELENYKAETLQDIVDGDLPSGPVREALGLRLQINKASTKKLDSMLRQRSANGRACYQTRYHGALTGRSTGSGFQPYNLKRGFEDLDPEQLVRDIRYESATWLKLLYGDPITAVSNATRHWIMAEEGNEIISGDFVSVEAVVLSCLAGEQWKIDAFRRKDPIYELMACKIHNLGEDMVALAKADKEEFKAQFAPERQDGKTGELAFGFQGALGAWLKFDKSGRHSDERIIEICKIWRGDHPMTTTFWGEMDMAAINAVLHPGVEYGYREVTFKVIDNWLSMRGLDGKRIWYWDPQVRPTMPIWHRPADKEECADGSCRCEPVPQLTYMSWKNKQFRRVSTYGGKLTENITQKEAREILKEALRRIEQRGYHPILDVYDEVVCEEAIGLKDMDDFKEVMISIPTGAPYSDWPIGVSAWRGKRYRK